MKVKKVGYWTYSKKEDKFFWQEKTKSPNFVQEVYEEKDIQTYHHTLTSHWGKTVEFTSYCGYDRGPKKQAIIRKLYFGI
jgi:hypothetical protein